MKEKGWEQPELRLLEILLSALPDEYIHVKDTANEDTGLNTEKLKRAARNIDANNIAREELLGISSRGGINRASWRQKPWGIENAMHNQQG